MNEFWSLLFMPFVLRALFVGITMSLSLSMLGTFLVLKRYSLIGDGLAHVSFFAVALSLLLGDTSPWIAVFVLIVASILILKLNDSGKALGDAAIGMLGAVSIALATILVQYVGNQYVNLESYLFGEIFLVRTIDSWFSLGLGVIVFIWVLIFYRSLFSMTYDEDFARINDVPVTFLRYSLAILTALAIYVGIRVVGTLLISSFIIFPPITAMIWNRSFKGTLISSVLLSLFNFSVGFLFALLLEWPAGSTIVVTSAVVYLFVLGINTLQRRLKS